MKTYSEFRPTGFDAHHVMSGRENWLLVPCARNRDSGCLAESNFHVALKELGGESDTVEVHRFGHWGPGWFEIIIVQPGTDAHATGLVIESSLENCPLLDEDDLNERETEAANETWKNCYDAAERIEYIREHERDFEFQCFTDMLGCVRGNYFAGIASELLG